MARGLNRFPGSRARHSELEFPTRATLAPTSLETMEFQIRYWDTLLRQSIMLYLFFVFLPFFLELLCLRITPRASLSLCAGGLKPHGPPSLPSPHAASPISEGHRAVEGVRAPIICGTIVGIPKASPFIPIVQTGLGGGGLEQIHAEEKKPPVWRQSRCVQMHAT